jgi:hypothetical protein
MEMVYQYLTGPDSGNTSRPSSKSSAKCSPISRATMRLWATREAQLNGVISASTRFYGDLQSIAGRAMPDIDSLDLLTIEDKSAS